MFTLRPFAHTSEDYEALANIRQASYADNRMRAHDFKRIDDYTPQDEYDWERTIAEWNVIPPLSEQINPIPNGDTKMVR